MPSRYSDRRERREPEKTPLIDVIFLLLIFFFVTVVNLDITPKPTYGSKRAGTQQKLDLLPMTNPMEQAPDTLDKAVLLQIQATSDLDETAIRKFNKVISDLNRLNQPDFEGPVPLARSDFLIFILDQRHSDVTSVQALAADLSSKVQDFRISPSTQLKTQILASMHYLPISLPGKNDHNFDEKYKATISTLTTRLQSYFRTPRAREVHIRMDPEIYVKVIDDLFKLCNRERVQVENIKFRVLELKS